jgi:hypothetical protein
MNEPYGRKVKYDYRAQMTDTHKRMRPDGIYLPAQRHTIRTNPYSSSSSSGRPLEKPATVEMGPRRSRARTRASRHGYSTQRLRHRQQTTVDGVGQTIGNNPTKGKYHRVPACQIASVAKPKSPRPPRCCQRRSRAHSKGLTLATDYR